MDSELVPGRLLSGEELRGLLMTPDRVFHNNTWDPKNLTTAGYYARMAGGPLVIPERKGGYRSIQETDDQIAGFRLRPGESAVISTIECFSISLDISVSIGVRFGEAAQGLLMLYGSTAHPGYGRQKNDDGSWFPRENTRLYFVVANVGPEELELRRFEKIVYLQFFSVSPDPLQDEVPSKGYEYLKEKLYDAQDAGGLSFFRTIKDMEATVSELTAGQRSVFEEADRRLSDIQRVSRSESATQEALMNAKWNNLQDEIEHIRTTAERVSNASNFVVVFGVFLVAAAILGVTLDGLSGAISEAHSTIEDWRDVTLLVLASLYGIAAAGGVIAVVFAVRAASKRPAEDARKLRPATKADVEAQRASQENPQD